MILQSINLHNFMSYADAHLDLSAISVACLCGANGAGKSALLDAVTWAVWEEARAASEKLIRQEQKEMWVDIVFTLEGSTYRIRRSRQITPSRSGDKVNSKGSLDLHINNGNGKQGDWLSLTAASTKETQQKIGELLKMDYQTFVNSAYLRQGAADQFARKMPAERKQILGEILGLSEFDRLQELCREQLKPLKEKCERLSGLLSRLPEIEEQIKQLEGEKIGFTASLNDARAQKDKLEADLSLWQKKAHEIEARQEKQKGIEVQLVALADEINILGRQNEELKQRFDNLKDQAAKQSQLESELIYYEQTVAAVKKLDEKSLAAQNLEKQKSDTRAMLSQERTQLEVELKQAQKEANELLQHRIKITADLKNQDVIVSEYKQYQEMLVREEELSCKQEAYAQIKQRMTDLQTTVDEAQIRLSTEIEQKKEQLTKLKAIADSESFLEKQKAELEAQEAELEKKEKEFQFVADKGQQLKTTIENIARQIDDLGKSQAEYARKIEELSKAADSTICPLCSAPIIDRAAVIKRYEDAIIQAKSDAVSLEHEQSQLEGERTQLRAQYSQLNNELALRKDLDKQIGQFKEKSRVIKETRENEKKLTQEIESLIEQSEKNDYAAVQKASLINLGNELGALQFDPALYSGVQSQIRSQRGIESRHNQLLRDLAELNKIDLAAPALDEKIQSLQIILSEESYGGTSRDAIRDLEQQFQEIDYDSAKHSQFKEKLTALLPSVEKYKDIKRALAEMPNLEKNIADTQKWLIGKVNQQTNLTQELQTADWSIDNSAPIETEIISIKTILKEAQSNYELAVHEQAKVLASLEQAKKEILDLAEKKSQLNEARTALDDFTFLAECFGKKGIQAIIIENAIPEIEIDANRILSRLSDNKMHIALITQQKNKSGSMAETLDIEISDELGRRSYELYSGGEAFKVNFAIRVALSRLLARRAGAKLETLIIDEGFGSQDDYSRDKLVKAINSIQPDFARILVITHFSDVKEMFPNHILINKSSGTSQIELIN